jgi:hypothetical protein
MESGLEPVSLSVSGAFNDVASKRGLIRRSCSDRQAEVGL